MINSVKGQTPVIFDDLVRRPQTYTTNPKPNASTNIAEEKNGSFGKVVAGILIAAAVTIGALATGKHFNVYDRIASSANKKIGNETVKKVINNVLKGLDKAGGKIIQYGVSIKNSITNLFKKKAVPEGEIPPSVPATPVPPSDLASSAGDIVPPIPDARLNGNIG